MQDAFGRRIDYLRVSATDRCDLRCSYCMNDETRFVSRPEILTLEEIERLCALFMRMGVQKLRITGGEPLIRRNVLSLFENLGQWLGRGLSELSLTTNATRLADYASGLALAGVKRVNVSLDTLDPAIFKSITRQGDLARVLAGIKAARAAGLRVKLNCVLMKGVNEHEIANLLAWSHERGCDLVLIETMPMGEARSDLYLPLDAVLERLSQIYRLEETDERTNGPARYLKVQETGGRLGLIAPLSHHFCDSCNRVRLTAAGKLHLCLGREDGVDLRSLLRANESDQAIEDAILNALAVKPRGHDFVAGGTLSQGPGAVRAMSATGG
ncbi:MAG: GTP 3',8-cyclase MoaA [Alphaproteobacteria bacterium]|nr:GTP 3',8-cyclase MoaA [Alphaproteobacteria bacterium]